MARLLGLNIEDSSKVGFALTSFYGIGWNRAIKLLESCNIDNSKRVRDLTEEELKKIVNFVEENYQIEGELREKVAGDIKRLKDIGSYRGLRHSRNLPVKGQRTRSNARTKRGKRKTVGALKKEDQARVGLGDTTQPDKKNNEKQ